MSSTTTTPPDEPTDDWEDVAEHTDILEMLIEEETSAAERAQGILDELERRGLY